MGFLDEGKTRQTLDRLTLNVYDRPPFSRKGGDPFRSNLLRRFYCEQTGPSSWCKQWCWVDKRGRLMRGASLGALLAMQGFPKESVDSSLSYIQDHHSIMLVPYAYEGVVFWREHPERASYVFVNAAQDLSHLL